MSASSLPQGKKKEEEISLQKKLRGILTACLKGDGLAFITPKKYAALKKPHFLDTSQENIQRGVKFGNFVKKFKSKKSKKRHSLWSEAFSRNK